MNGRNYFPFIRITAKKDVLGHGRQAGTFHIGLGSHDVHILLELESFLFQDHD